ncbi:MAG: hypothetical protein ACC645_27315 [Pirellulales bacterium]
MMKRAVFSLAGVAAIGLMVAVAGGAAGLQRGDCPGKVVCPLTGDEVCKDQCPLADATRDDCPGKIECPIDGNLVCRDRCPADNAEPETTGAMPSCCQEK